MPLPKRRKPVALPAMAWSNPSRQMLHTYVCVCRAGVWVGGCVRAFVFVCWHEWAYARDKTARLSSCALACARVCVGASQCASIRARTNSCGKEQYDSQ